MEERENITQYMISQLSQSNVHIDDSPSQKSFEDFMMTCVAACNDALRKEQKLRSDMQDNYKLLELESKQNIQELEEKSNKIQQLECEVSRLENLINVNNLKYKQERDKMTLEKEQMRKELSNTKNLCKQYAHEIKKRETEYTKLQDQMRKCMGEKDLQYKNTAEMMNEFHKNGLNFNLPRGEEEFIHFLKQGHISQNKNIKEIIDLLKETVENVFAVFQKEMQRLECDLDWKPLNLNSYEEFRNEVEFRLKSLEFCLKNLKKIEDDKEFPQESVPVLKQILDSYKEIIDSNLLALLRT
jgi:hypothetical protein